MEREESSIVLDLFHPRISGGFQVLPFLYSTWRAKSLDSAFVRRSSPRIFFGLCFYALLLRIISIGTLGCCRSLRRFHSGTVLLWTLFISGPGPPSCNSSSAEIGWSPMFLFVLLHLSTRHAAANWSAGEDPLSLEQCTVWPGVRNSKLSSKSRGC